MRCTATLLRCALSRLNLMSNPSQIILSAGLGFGPHTCNKRTLLLAITLPGSTHACDTLQDLIAEQRRGSFLK